MKNTFTTLVAAFCILIFSEAKAQTALPYYTGFDNASEQQGWVGFRKGDSSLYNWAFTSNGAYSAPSSLYHDYPVGGTAVTDDWYVSPAFDLSSGGRIDSLRYKFSGFGVPAAGDTVAVYLLTGSQDPELAASKTILVDYRGAAYNIDNAWYLNSPVIIPPTAGQSFIAFRYTTTVNWLDVRFDNLSISENVPVGISENHADQIALFPNPVAGEVTIQVTEPRYAGREMTLSVFNSVGALVLQEKVNQETARVKINQPAGAYFYQLSINNQAVKTGKLTVK